MAFAVEMEEAERPPSDPLEWSFTMRRLLIILAILLAFLIFTPFAAS
jgi:hypothetical protein